MKWTPIAKAKLKFDQQYLVAMQSNRPACGFLAKSEILPSGILHTFDVDGFDTPQIATHVAIVTDPNE